MKTTHTLGPWEYYPLSGTIGGAPKNLFGSGRELVATIFKRGVHAEANARLVASAPELLEAAQAVLDELDPESNGCLELVRIISRIKGEMP